MRKDQIIISCKVSRPRDLVAIYRDLANKTDQPLHLGLTEAGMGQKGLVWSAASMGILLNEGIGDTIRVSLTPKPGGDRREEVYAACELLQALGLRSFAPSVTACPGCGRTTSSTFQELAERTQDYIRERMPQWKKQYEGVETLTLAVMGCVVNGPGESKAANIGISLPGTGEAPNCPVYIDGEHVTTMRGNYDELAEGFRALLDNYVATHYSIRSDRSIGFGSFSAARGGHPVKAGILSILAVGLNLLMATGALAHHSFAMEFDDKKPVTLTGVITKVEWANPHVRFYLDVKDAGDQVTSWELTLPSTLQLLRRGWTRNLLVVGETTTGGRVSRQRRFTTGQRLARHAEQRAKGANRAACRSGA